MIGEKTEAVKPDVSHREHNNDGASDDMTQHEEDELQRRVSRRPSAAVNVIQNPLQVRAPPACAGWILRSNHNTAIDAASWHTVLAKVRQHSQRADTDVTASQP